MESNEIPTPPLLAELAINDEFTKELIRFNFNFILQAIKTRRNIEILKQDGYFERAVSLYNDEDFRSLHFLLSAETDEVLVQLVGNRLEIPSVQQGPGKKSITVEKQVLISLWYLEP